MVPYEFLCTELELDVIYNYKLLLLLTIINIIFIIYIN
jgi:hypothetical protein